MPFVDPPTQPGLNQSTSSVSVQAAPALTILWHPDPARIGALSSLSDLRRDRPLALSRLTPYFDSYCEKSAPLADSFLSRQTFLELALRDQELILTPTPGSPIALDGRPITGPTSLSASDIAHGPILTIGRRIALCLHFAVSPTSGPAKDFGLLGNSDSMAAVRQSILAIAPLATPVLIRGETGTGKELTVNAIVANGPRRNRPFLAVNIGALPPQLAASEIFGHERGAFTDARGERNGYFHEANGGTLFLDEIGLAHADVQTALLRALETGQVRRLGGSTSKQVDVRLLAATDSTTIDRAVDGGGFSQALYHRLSAFSIRLPPLRSRRQDLGVLLLHFLKQALSETGDLDKLQTPSTAKRPWLSAEVFPSLAAASWPGNVRQLRNFATEVAIANRGLVLARVPEALWATVEATTATGSPSQIAPVEILSKTDTITPEKLAEALERNDFKPAKAARALRVARSTIYEHMRRDPNLNLLSRMSSEDFQRHVDDCNGDLRLVAKRLRVSYRAVQLRSSKT